MSDKNQNGNGKHTEVVQVAERLERALDAVDRYLASGNDVTLDFSTCDFISVDGIEWLEEVLLRSESLAADVTFINLNPKLYKVFKVAHIDSLQKACGAPSSTLGPAC
ncbi:MAG TPA: STAS domain-containing protein [Planktothrix sp.]|jgi:anti-anti-sigma regulatory factor